MTDSADVHRHVQEQFGATAAAYTRSPGHGDATALAFLVSLAAPQPEDVALDIATGAGHTALAFAPHVRQVVAYDLTPAMLAETAKTATQRGLTNVVTQQGPAEELPFADASFDIVTVRLASHHFADNARAVREMARVARPGARILIIDNYGPEDPALDEQLQEIEKLRDASHVRSYTLSVWNQLLCDAGLHIEREITDRYSESARGMHFADWVTRSKTPPDRVQKLRAIFQNASPALRQLLAIDIDGDEIWFCLPQVTLLARK